MRTNPSGSVDVFAASVLYLITQHALPSPRAFVYLIPKEK